MIIKGLQKTTLIDYPEKVACTVFIFGCNFRCPYCHNPELVITDETPEIGQEKILQFLEERKDFLDGVVVTGGEPVLNKDLPEFFQKIKKLGLSIKLDTNGTNPEMVEQLIKDKLIDYIAMDIKAPIGRYEEVVGASVDIEKIKKSVEIVRKSGLDYEFRMTVPPDNFTEKDFVSIGEWLKGSKKFYLQQFKGIKTLDKKLIGKTVSREEMEKFCSILKPFFDKCEIR
jgi:pyruvate formate lyase activating enzyme